MSASTSTARTLLRAECGSGGRREPTTRRHARGIEEPPQLHGVRRGLRHPPELCPRIRRARVVVAQRVGLLRLLRQLSQRPDPLAEFVLRIEVVEPLGRTAAALVPRAEVAAVE